MQSDPLPSQTAICKVERLDLKALQDSRSQTSALRSTRATFCGMASRDPVALGEVSPVLVVVTLLVCWIPARRATKVDPMIAFRANE